MSGEFQKETINPLGNPLLTVTNLAMAAAMSLQPIRDYRMNVLWSQFEKKVIYQDKESFLPETSDVFLQGLGVIRGVYRRGRRRHHSPSSAPEESSSDMV